MLKALKFPWTLLAAAPRKCWPTATASPATEVALLPRADGFWSVTSMYHLYRHTNSNWAWKFLFCPTSDSFVPLYFSMKLHSPRASVSSTCHRPSQDPTAAWWSCLGVWSKTKEPHRLIPLWIRDSSTIKLWFHAVAKFGSSLGCFSLNHGSRTQPWEWPAQVPKQTRKIHADESHFWLDIQ